MNYIVYDKAGKILRTIQCPETMRDAQTKEGEFIMEGEANDSKQKIVKGRIVNKTPKEIEAEKPPEISISQRPAHITNKQWQHVLKRLGKLENR